jgi:hypothetical protein
LRVCTTLSLGINQLIDTGCFHFFATFTRAVVKMRVQMFFQQPDFFSFVYIPKVRLPGHMIVLFLIV